MVEVLTAFFIAIVALTVGAVAIYIAGFLVSMVAAVFAAVADAATHHHHRGQPAA